MKIFNLFRKKEKKQPHKEDQPEIRKEEAPCSPKAKDPCFGKAIEGRMRHGDGEALADKFIQMTEKRRVRLHMDDLDPYALDYDAVLAVHYADGGAQGEAGAVRILCRSPYGLRILYGNYVYGNLNLGAVIQKLPMLQPLDSRFRLDPLPYPFGGSLDVPDDWKYLYMGAMNHYYLKREICDEANEFIQAFLRSGEKWYVFEAIAWLYGMEPTA